MNLFKHAKWLLAAACFSVAMAGEAKPAPAAAAGENPDEEFDTVVVTSGPVFPPTHVIQDDYTYVVGKARGTIKKEAYLVKDIVYADKSPSYSRAVEKRDEGRYTVAALNFTNALDEMKDVKWAKEYCNYGIASAFYAVGFFNGYTGKTGRKYDPAAEYYKRVLEANPKSRFMLDVVTKLPVCYAEQGKIAEAKEALKSAAANIKKFQDETAKLGPGYAEPAERATVQLAIAQAKLTEKQATSKDNEGQTIANARDQWHDARGRARKFPDLLGECVDGEFRCMIADKKYDDAKTQANELITRFSRDNEYSLLSQLPAAYIALGQANYEQAREYIKKGNKPLANGSFAEARWAFLNVIAQFFDNEEYVAFAHYMAGVCYDQLKDQEPEDAVKKAIREWNTVVVSFPKSDYKAKAVEQLKAHGVSLDDTGKPVAPAATATPVAPVKPEAPATPATPAAPPKAAPPKKEPKQNPPKAAPAKPAEAKPATKPATTPSTTDKKK